MNTEHEIDRIKNDIRLLVWSVAKLRQTVGTFIAWNGGDMGVHNQRSLLDELQLAQDAINKISNQ